MVTAELIPPGVDFTQVYTLLTQHQQSNGSLIVPPNHPVLNKILDVLTAQGFEKLADERWNDMTNKVHNTPNVKEGGDEESKEWLQLQRDPYIKYEEMHKLDFNSDDNNEENGKSNNLPNPLSKERFDKLRNAGVAMNKWEQRLNELRQYYEEKGDCDVPVNHPGGLGLWVASQRVAYRYDKATMPQGRIDALDAMSFTWQSEKRKDSWTRYFDQLVKYIQQHGTSHVSFYDENYSKLGSWVKRQRAEYKKYTEKGRAKSQMTKERIDKLESIGFQWRLKPEKVRITWEDRFESLKEYKATHGHCRPKQSENLELNTWSRYQRLHYQYFVEGKPSRLNQEKVDRLLSIGINDPANPSQATDEQEDLV